MLALETDEEAAKMAYRHLVWKGGKNNVGVVPKRNPQTECITLIHGGKATYRIEVVQRREDNHLGICDIYLYRADGGNTGLCLLYVIGSILARGRSGIAVQDVHSKRIVLIDSEVQVVVWVDKEAPRVLVDDVSGGFLSKNCKNCKKRLKGKTVHHYAENNDAENTPEIILRLHFYVLHKDAELN